MLSSIIDEVPTMAPELARFGHIALETPDLETSRWFFSDLMGLREVDREDDAVYLRSARDREHHTLSLTEADEASVDHVAWRTQRPEDVAAFADQFESNGIDVEWIDAGEETGQGEAIRFHPPGTAQTYEYYYDVERPGGPDEVTNPLRNRPYSLTRTGRVNPLRLDHLALGVVPADETIDWYTDDLDFRTNEYIEMNDGTYAGAWLSVTSQSHDVAIINPPNLTDPGLHHVAYYVDSLEELYDAADVLRENGVEIDGGPGRHGGTQAEFLYVKDPGSGHRMELYTGAYHVFDPDWEPIRWGQDEMMKALLWYGETPGFDTTPF
jgi:catechol 2,3-dioxygenase